MFESIKFRLFVAKVQAELKAQYNNQAFVNSICQLPENLENLAHIRENSYYRKDSVAPFLAVCHVLDHSLNSLVLPLETRKICAALLAQRLQKASDDPQFHLRHVMIFGDMEQRLFEWGSENGVI